MKTVPAKSKTTRSAYINARVEPKLKSSATRILEKVGLSTSDAVTLFLKQVVLQNGVPFPTRIPNAATSRAIKEMQNPKTKKHTAKTTEEMFEEILGKDWREKYT